ncbi:MAG: competence/damage-inducible protein A [Bacteroidetes bacterium]|jgi:nicotinamide-nucleotide amidase|nr:competence/damage-inducible protein A [Bacteroidota bacterium]
MIYAELISIGDELLIGQVVNTNAPWISRQLNTAGFAVKQITVVSDNENEIISALDSARQRVDVILITGGLGPTKDDLTKIVLCKYFNTHLVFDPQAYKDIESIFKARGREVTATNRTQAELPASCIPIYNKNGTAPGMWFNDNGKIFVSMPGVPFEMESMVTDFVIPKLRQELKTTPVIHKTILTQGIGESYLSDMIAEWENNLPSHLKLAYLPAAGMVRLRLTGMGEVDNLEEEMNLQLTTLKKIITPYIYGEGEETLASIIGKLLCDKGKTVATAESCTGGYIAHLITSVPGSSDYFLGSIVSYSNDIKIQELGVSSDTLLRKGAVSEEVAIQMAEGIRKKFKTDYAISTTGIAGPSGGSEEKPVGTVWIAVADEKSTITKKFLLGTNRSRVIQVASETALNQLRKLIIQQI